MALPGEILSRIFPQWQRFLVYGVLIICALGGVWFHGYTRGELKLYEYKVAEAQQTVRVVTRIVHQKEVIRVPYVKREIEIKEVFVPIEKEIVHIPDRAQCHVTRGWMLLHDAAAQAGRDLGAVDDARDTGIGEAAAASVVVRNYEAFHQVVNDLTACRAFVSGLSGILE